MKMQDTSPFSALNGDYCLIEYSLHADCDIQVGFSKAKNIDPLLVKKRSSSGSVFLARFQVLVVVIQVHVLSLLGTTYTITS